MPLLGDPQSDSGLKATLEGEGLSLYLPDEWIANEPSSGSVTVLEMSGRTIVAQTVMLGHIIQVYMPNAPAGVYAAVIEQCGRRTATRFIIP